MNGITLVVEDASWRSHRGLRTQLKKAAAFTHRHVKLNGEITILLADDARLQILNREFRGKDKPTNVLSFPSGEDDYDGDIALAYGVTAAEAMASGKSLAHHAVHLVVHGVLHLAGYDHVQPRDAKRMEPLEVKILNALGVADPYRVPPS